MAKIETLWFGNVNITKNRPSNIITYSERETVSVEIHKKGLNIDSHDNRSETKKRREIVLGPAFLRINKEVDDDNNFKRIVMYLHDSSVDEKEIKLEAGFQGTDFLIERDGEDIFDKIVVW